jgi:hypothetical protein
MGTVPIFCNLHLDCILRGNFVEQNLWGQVLQSYIWARIALFLTEKLRLGH